VDVQVWLGTIVNPNLDDYVNPALGDAATGPAITGVGYQWEGQEAMLATHNKYPDKKMMQTETECNNGANSWEEGAATFRKMIEDMNHFANSYMFWNMILSEKSTSTWGWKQNSLLKIDAQTKQIIYNPEFYSLKHFGHFVRPGAVRIGLSASLEAGRNGPQFLSQSLAAFRNPSGELVLILRNPNDAVLPVTVEAGERAAMLPLPAHSMNSVVLAGW
jgi:glucosylceramidase